MATDYQGFTKLCILAVSFLTQQTILAHASGCARFDQERMHRYLENCEEALEFKDTKVTQAYNSLGLRDRNPSHLKYKNWIILGDSLVSAPGVEQEKRFTNLIESQLIKNGHFVHLVNAGVRGYGPTQLYLLLKRIQPIYKPTGVIQLFSLNNQATKELAFRNDREFASDGTPISFGQKTFKLTAWLSTRLQLSESNYSRLLAFAQGFSGLLHLWKCRIFFSDEAYQKCTLEPSLSILRETQKYLKSKDTKYYLLIREDEENYWSPFIHASCPGFVTKAFEYLAPARIPSSTFLIRTLANEGLLVLTYIKSLESFGVTEQLTRSGDQAGHFNELGNKLFSQKNFSIIQSIVTSK